MKKLIRIDGDTAYIPLSRGFVAMIDAADVPKIEAWNWFAHPQRYTVYAECHVRKDGRRLKATLHRVIMDAPAGLNVDHIDGDGLNNRRANLRLATSAQNSANTRRPSSNTSGFKGVTLHKRTGKWQAQIEASRRAMYLGLFDTPEAAHAAYAKAATELHGQFARMA